MKKNLLKLFLVFLLLAAASNLLALAKDVPFVPTPEAVVDEMLTLAKVGPDDTVIDLGSGDGRIVIAAAKRGARATGVDIDPERIREANENAKEHGLQDKVKFIQQNLFDADLKPATVLTMYLLPSVNMKLRPKILSELQPGARVVSHAFDLGDWEPDHRQEQVYLWIVPANVSGKWDFEQQGQKGAPSALDLKQKFQMVSGTISADGTAHRIRNATLEGKRLQFTADVGGASQKYSFDVSGDSLQGQAGSGAIDAGPGGSLLKARRAQGTKKSIDGK